MQESRKEEEEEVVEELEYSGEYSRQASQKASLYHLMSRRSSRFRSGSGSRHSLSITFSLSRGLSVARSTDYEDLNYATEKMEKHPKVPLSRLFALNKPEIPILAVGTLSAVLNGAIVPFFGILLSLVIKTFNETDRNELRKDSKFWALMFVVLGAVSFVAYPLRTYFFGVAGSRLIRRVRKTCFEKVVNMEVGWFDEPENSSGVIGARLSADAATIRALVGDALAQIVQDLASAIVGLVIAFVASWQLSFIVLAMVPLIALNGFVQVKYMTGFSADAKVRISFLFNTYTYNSSAFFYGISCLTKKY